MPIPSTLGARLAQARREKAAREQRDIGQKEVAKAVGVSSASVSRWESDTDSPREAALAALAGFLEVTPAYLRYGIPGDVKQGARGTPALKVAEPKTKYGGKKA